MGSWNSQVIGLRFEITPSNTTKRDLIIRLGDHSPPKRVTLMDKSWTCTGFTLHRNGGPFYISAAKQKEEVLATFTGLLNLSFVVLMVGTQRYYTSITLL